MPAAVMTHAAKALSREGKGRTHLEIRPLIPAVPSASTVRPEIANTTATTNVPQATLTFADAEPATVKEPHVQHLPISKTWGGWDGMFRHSSFDNRPKCYRKPRRRIKKVKLCIDK